MDRNLSNFQEMVKDRGTWSAVVHGVTESQTQLSNGTTTTDDSLHFTAETNNTAKQVYLNF